MNRQEKLIAEIHAEFDTAQDRLLKEAKKVLNDVNTNVIGIAERLKSIGFKNTPTAKRGAEVKEKLVKSKDEATLIEYYAQTYPFLKFLTESELDRICKKYNLIYAPSDRYTEEVPEKNLRDIEVAQPLLNKDDARLQTYFSGKVWCAYEYKALDKILRAKCSDLSNVLFEKYETDKYISEETRIAIGVLDKLKIDRSGIDRHIWIDGTVTEVKRSGIFIAAPQSHFNTEGLKKKGLGFFHIFETEIKDPIVFRYVRGGVQVLTKWGLEANDPDLVVPKLN